MQTFDFFTVPSERVVNERRLEGWYQYNKIRQWGLRNPIEFTRLFMQIELLDLQKYVFMNTWGARYAAWLMCRNAGKTTEGAIYTMIRSILLPLHDTYIIGKVGGQAKETFMKIEDIAKKNVETFTGSTEYFLNEVVVRDSKSMGFSHLPESFSVELFNGSTINTVNSNPDNIRGKRAHEVFFDEAGWFSDELFAQGENYANQNNEFKTGVDLNLVLEPLNYPRQLIYGSSASDERSGYYTKVRSFTAEMMKGNRDYFVCDFNADVLLSATKDGEPYPSLISQEAVDKIMRDDPDKGQRELYNKFSAGYYEGQIVTPRTLMQYTSPTLPLLANDETNHRMALAWDSARMNDNSVTVVAEFVNDEKAGWKMRVANVVSFVDDKLKNRTPKPMPEQIIEFKKLLLAYNGTEYGKLDYENIEVVLGDAGAGGGMISGIADYLLANWEDEHGQRHKGLIDRAHKGYIERVNDWPDAVDKLQLIEPRAFRNDIFRAIVEMINLGVVEFPLDYDGKDYVMLFDEKEEQYRQNLSVEQQIALTQIQMLKTEITTMCKYVNGDTVSYNYPPEKRNKMHDDRVFAFGLLCLYLARLRHGQAIAPQQKQQEATKQFTVTPLDLFGDE